MMHNTINNKDHLEIVTLRARMGYDYERVLCPHCNSLNGDNNYIRCKGCQRIIRKR